MPRDRTVTMGKVTPQEAHAAAVRKSIKLYSPFTVTDGELVSAAEGKFAVIFTAPLGGDRKVYATRNKRANATALRDLLNEAWAEGHWASMRE